MKVTLESTSKVVKLNHNGVDIPARIWEGTTDTGIPVHAFIARIGVHETKDQAQFERELENCRAPSPEIDVYPLRLLI